MRKLALTLLLVLTLTNLTGCGAIVRRGGERYGNFMLNATSALFSGNR